MGEIITLGTGVQLETRAVSMWAIQKIKERVERERPKVPTKYLKEDERTIEVPEDPDYRTALEVHEVKLAEVIYDAMIGLGTKVLKVPEGMAKHTDKEWTEPLEVLNIPIPENGTGRYIAWVKLYAASTSNDLQNITLAITKAGGVSEEDVAKSAAMFRDRNSGGDNTGETP